jgi:hypothetical protein
MISIICVYNNESILRDYLLKGLECQTVRFELIKIDNTKSTFKSAAESLNYGGKKARGKYIMFAHQDVVLSSNSWLEDIENCLDSIPNLGIAGVAGVREGKNHKDFEFVTNIKDGIPPKNPGNVFPHNPEKVQTLDECTVIIPNYIFEKIQFDEINCNGWHLYAVDYCLGIKKLGLDSYVIPMALYHRSTGVENHFPFLELYPSGYYQTLGKVLKKHKIYEKIYTTCGMWSTVTPLICQRIILIIRKLAVLRKKV